MRFSNTFLSGHCVSITLEDGYTHGIVSNIHKEHLVCYVIVDGRLESVEVPYFAIHWIPELPVEDYNKFLSFGIEPGNNKLAEVCLPKVETGFTEDGYSFDSEGWCESLEMFYEDFCDRKQSHIQSLCDNDPSLW